MSEHRIGWLGTGRMGTAMATRLISGGAAVTVWNRTAAKTAPLVQLGASRADTVSELDRCDIVFTSVTSSSDLLAVTSGPEGLFTVFSAQPAPRIVVDTSTVSAEVRREAAGRGIGFLSAPISGNANVVAEGRSVDWLGAGFDVHRVQGRCDPPSRLRAHLHHRVAAQGLRSGLGAARSLEVPMPVAATTYQAIQTTIGHGYGKSDFATLYEVAARAAAIARD